MIKKATPNEISQVEQILLDRGIEKSELHEFCKVHLEAGRGQGEEMKELIVFLSLNLRDHILKENNILYPSALKRLEGWDKIKEGCDDIGYCCFTPSG